MRLTRFRQPDRTPDLLCLATSMSDDLAGDVLSNLVPPAEVTDTLARLELTGIIVRHRMQPLAETPRSASPAMRGPWLTSLRSRRPPPAETTRFAARPVRANTGAASRFVALLAELGQSVQVSGGSVGR
jgi:hypothetical protein